MKNITIKDIAKELGIHHATVSRALRDNSSVKKETRDKIWAKAKELGYRPNRLAQEFRNMRSNTIVALVPDLKHHFFSEFISEFSKEAISSGFSVMIFQSDGKLRMEKEIIDSLCGYRIAGVVVSVSKETGNSNHFRPLDDIGIPYVFFDRVPKDARVSSVMLDNFQAAYDAVKLLVNSGRKRIAFVTTPDTVNVFSDRFSGYKKALQDSNVLFDDQLVLKEGLLMEDGVSAAKKLLSLHQRPDAVFAIRDELAIGVLKYLKKTGLNVPEDISVIGFDNDPMGVACDPELTTVSQLIPQMAAMTFDMVMRQINNIGNEAETKILKAEIILRGSV